MDFSSINWLAVVACVFASMIIGSVWFHPKTFFPVWWQAIGKSENDGPSSTNMGINCVLRIRSSCFHVTHGSRHGKHDAWGRDTWLRRNGWVHSLAWLCGSIEFDEQIVCRSIKSLGA